MIAGGRRHLTTPTHHHHVTLALLLHAIHVSGPTAVNTLLLQSKSNTPGQFHLERKGTVERGHTHNLLSDLVPHLTMGCTGTAIEVRPLTGHHCPTMVQGARAVAL